MMLVMAKMVAQAAGAETMWAMARETVCELEQVLLLKQWCLQLQQVGAGSKTRQEGRPVRSQSRSHL